MIILSLFEGLQNRKKWEKGSNTKAKIVSFLCYFRFFKANTLNFVLLIPKFRLYFKNLKLKKGRIKILQIWQLFGSHQLKEKEITIKLYDFYIRVGWKKLFFNNQFLIVKKFVHWHSNNGKNNIININKFWNCTRALKFRGGGGMQILKT